MEIPPLILKMTTKNLIALYRAERKRMYMKGYRLIGDEDEDGNLTNVTWSNQSGRDKHFKEDVEYFEMLKSELDKRPHEPNKQKWNN